MGKRYVHQDPCDLSWGFYCPIDNRRYKYETWEIAIQAAIQCGWMYHH